MRSEQWELRLAVVESVHIGPRPSVVTGLAAKRGAVGPTPRHAVLKLTVMGVLMASCAAAVFKVEGQNLIRAMRHLRLVTIVARDGYVRARQGVFRIAMLGNGEERAVKILHGMAVFTAIVIRRAGKLLVVHVLMAVRAVREFHLVNRVLAGREMAFIAFHLCVLAVEGIPRGGMLLYPEERWLPPFHRVTLGALALLGARLELAFMSVLVAVHAVRERKWLLEVAVDVARRAADRGVFSR